VSASEAARARSSNVAPAVLIACCNSPSTFANRVYWPVTAARTACGYSPA
jgi:hypothetical protein